MTIEEFPKTPKPENPYLDMVAVKRVDKLTARKQWYFVVSENFDIYITTNSHDYVHRTFGVNPDRSLTEGYISFNPDGTVLETTFKPQYQPVPGFKKGPEELKKLQDAVDDKIKESLNKDISK